MKRIVVSLLIALTAAPLAIAPVAAEAATVRLASEASPATVVQAAFWQDGPPVNRRNRGRERGNDNDGRGRDGGGQRNDWRGGSNFDRGNRNAERPRREDRSDGRIRRAMDIASSRGKVLDAGQQSGSVFWARVATPNGRVDILVDTDSGRIIGER